MNITDDVKKVLLKFKENYSEWSDYKIVSNHSNFSVLTNEDKKVSVQAAGELLSDLAVELKNQNLMIDKKTLDSFTIAEYTYQVEEGLEDLADELELLLGKNISDLVVKAEKDVPKVSFKFIGNLSTVEKDSILKKIQELLKSYVAVDELGIQAEIEFDNYEDIIEIIDNNYEEMEEEL